MILRYYFIGNKKKKKKRNIKHRNYGEILNKLSNPRCRARSLPQNKMSRSMDVIDLNIIILKTILFLPNRYSNLIEYNSTIKTTKTFINIFNRFERNFFFFHEFGGFDAGYHYSILLNIFFD